MSQASIETFHNEENAKQRKSQRTIILEAIKEHGPVNQDRLVFLTRLTEHVISRRVSELHDDGEIHGSIMRQVDNRRYQTFYSVATSEQKELIRNKRQKQRYLKWLKHSDEFVAYFPDEVKTYFSNLKHQ